MKHEEEKILRIQKCKAKDVGSCNFCYTGSKGGHMTNDTIYVVTGKAGGPEVRFCKACLMELKIAYCI